MYHYRNRAQLTVAYDHLIAVMQEMERDLPILISTGGFCCGSCGSHAFWNRLQEWENPNIGYLFWHVQNDDVFENGGKLYLHHSSRKGDVRSDHAFAARICGVFKKHGITHHWNGSYKECIMVPVAADPRYAERQEAEWRETMIQNGEDPDEPDSDELAQMQFDDDDEQGEDDTMDVDE